MRKLLAFNNITLDGYFSGAGGDLSWAYKKRAPDPEWDAFVAGNAQGGGQGILGRVTYELMAKYWPTEEAAHNNMDVANGINSTSKVVISKTLDRAAWRNTVIVRSDLPGAIRELKQRQGADMVILGSGSVVAQFTAEGLIDEYQFVVNPVVIGKGRTMFEGLTQHVELTRGVVRTFNNGNVLLTYTRGG